MKNLREKSCNKQLLDELVLVVVPHVPVAERRHGELEAPWTEAAVELHALPLAT